MTDLPLLLEITSWIGIALSGIVLGILLHVRACREENE